MPRPRRLCPGDAKLTCGYRLPACYVIHTVGPVWHGGTAGEAELLAACYRRVLQVAAEAGIGSLAFPAISTGIFGYPFAAAAAIAVGTVQTHAPRYATIREVVFCCFSVTDCAVYEALLATDT